MFKVLVISENSSFKDALALSLKETNIKLLHSFFIPAKYFLPENDSINMLIVHSQGPSMTAWKLCLEYRANNGFLPVIIVSDLVAEADQIVSLSIGVDEHLSNSDPGLANKVKAISQRPYIRNPKVISLQGLSIDLSRHAVCRDGRKINLTRTELSILEHILKHPGKIFHCGDLIDLLWSNPEGVFEETIRCHIKNLRKKLDSPFDAKSIVETVHGQGYKLCENGMQYGYSANPC